MAEQQNAPTSPDRSLMTRRQRLLTLCRDRGTAFLRWLREDHQEPVQHQPVRPRYRPSKQYRPGGRRALTPTDQE